MLITPAIDVWGLGCILFAMASGGQDLFHYRHSVKSAVMSYAQWFSQAKQSSHNAALWEGVLGQAGEYKKRVMALCHPNAKQRPPMPIKSLSRGTLA